MKSPDVREQLSRIALRALLALFLIPGLTLGLAYHFRQATDREYTTALLANTEGAANQSRAALLESTPPSATCFASDPGLAQYRSAVCAIYSPMWQFVVMERVAYWTVIGGLSLLALMAVLGGAAFARRKVQYLSFVIGWRTLVLASAAEIVVQGTCVVWLSYWITVFFMHAYVIKLIAVVGVIALLAMFVAIVTIFKRVPINNAVHGELITPEAAPHLWSRVRDLASRVQTAPPEQIVAGIDANFFVTEQPLRVGQHTTRGRALFVSIPLLRLLDQDEADAVLAHELGHFAGGDTASSAALGPKLAQYDFYAEHMRRGGATVIAFFLLILYRVIFEIALRKSSRDREFAADGVATRLTSPRAIAQALVKVAAYGNYRAQVEKQLFGQQTAHADQIGIAHKVASGLPAFGQSRDFTRIVRAGRIPHPFDSHPPLTERMRMAGYEVPEDQFATIVCTAPATTWVGSIAAADVIEARLWQEFERHFSQAHEQSLAYRHEPANDEERALVLRYFPPVHFELKKGKRFGVVHEGMILPDGQTIIPWDAVKALQYRDATLGADRLTVTYHPTGKFNKSISKIPLPIARKDRQRLKETLGRYWKRHQIMRAHQVSERGARIARDAFPAEH